MVCIGQVAKFDNGNAIVGDYSTGAPACGAIFFPGTYIICVQADPGDGHQYSFANWRDEIHGGMSWNGTDCPTLYDLDGNIISPTDDCLVDRPTIISGGYAFSQSANPRGPIPLIISNGRSPDSVPAAIRSSLEAGGFAAPTARPDISAVPSTICQAGILTVPFSIAHQCAHFLDIPLSLEVENLLTGETLTRNLTLSTLRTEIEIPLEIPTDYPTGRQRFFDYRWSSPEAGDSDTVDATFALPNTAIAGFDVPSAACLGTQFRAALRARNVSQCAAAVRAILRNRTTGGQQTSDEVSLESGSERQFPVEVSMGSAAREAGQVAIEMELQQRARGNWETVGTREGVVDLLTAAFQITGTNYPTTLQPGRQTDAAITIQNTGDCASDASVSGSQGLSQTLSSMAPGETRHVTHTIEQGPTEADIAVDVTNEQLGEAADAFQQVIELEQAVAIDTLGGELRLFGGFGSVVPWAGTAYGQGFEGRELEQRDAVAGVRVATFGGRLGASGRDVDVIAFDALSYLYLGLETQTVFVQDREIVGEGETYEYNATPLPSASLRPADDAPDVSVRPRPYNPRGLAGGIRGLFPFSLPGAGGPESAFD